MHRTQILHSRYNPKAEAERFLDSIDLKKDLKIIILIEPGMGYMTASLRIRNPNTKIIALHAEQIPESLPKENIPDACWSPETGKSLRYFLEQEIPDMEAKEIKIIEWRPALSVYGQSYLNLLDDTVKFIKQADASARTQNLFGKKWFKNFFSNLNLLSNIIIPDSFSCQFLITGSGPGLEDSLEEIKKNKNNFFLLAVSSSVASLTHKNINPDLIISVDGGNWALLHLFECIRNTSKIKLAINMTAALPSQCQDASFLVICDGSLWQSIILKELKIPFITLPQRGTVSASALDLAFSLTNSNVIITGMDLSQKDLLDHTRPYAFDKLWDEKASRLCPYYSQVYNRTNLSKSSGIYDIYSSWFRHQVNKYPKRLYALNKNNMAFNSLESISFDTLVNNNKPIIKTSSIKFSDNPARLAANILLSALKNSKIKNELSNELRLLIFPNTYISESESFCAEELNNTILELTQSLWVNTKNE